MRAYLHQLRLVGQSGGYARPTFPQTLGRHLLVHTPIHASWVNQIEIYFSIVQRKVLTPNDFDSLATIARRLQEFEHLYNQISKPFGWKFTRNDLNDWLTRLADRQAALALAA